MSKQGTHASGHLKVEMGNEGSKDKRAIMLEMSCSNCPVSIDKIPRGKQCNIPMYKFLKVKTFYTKVACAKYLERMFVRELTERHLVYLCILFI